LGLVALGSIGGALTDAGTGGGGAGELSVAAGFWSVTFATGVGGALLNGCVPAVERADGAGEFEARARPGARCSVKRASLGGGLAISTLAVSGRVAVDVPVVVGPWLVSALATIVDAAGGAALELTLLDEGVMWLRYSAPAITVAVITPRGIEY
jgi:hypothetical protein